MSSGPRSCLRDLEAAEQIGGCDESHGPRLVELFFRLTAVGPRLGTHLFDVSDMFIKHSIHLIHAVPDIARRLSDLSAMSCADRAFLSQYIRCEPRPCVVHLGSWCRSSHLSLVANTHRAARCRLSHPELRRDAGGCVFVAVSSSAISAARLNCTLTGA